MRIPARLLRAVALCVAALLLSGCNLQAYDLPLPGKQVDSDDGYQVTATFRDVVDVVPRTLVMANDVPVGQVDAVKRVGWHARVTMTIKKNIVLPADAVADVRQTSLLGEKYIALRGPAGSSVAKNGRLADGADIPLSRTGRNPEVEEVLGALSFLLSGGGVGQLKTISTELNKMMDGRQDQMRDLLHQLDTMVGSLDESKDAIISAMTQVNRLSKTLNREKKAISDALDSFGPALKVLREQHQQMMTMLHGLDRLGSVATRVINRSGANITQALKDLEPTLHELADAGDSLPRGLMMAASFPFPKQAKDLAMGDYSNALFQMDIDLGKMLDGLTGKSDSTGLPQLLQICKTYTSSCGQVEQAVSSLCKATGVKGICSLLGAKDDGTAGRSTTSGQTLQEYAKDLAGGGRGGGDSGLGSTVGDLTKSLSGTGGGR